MFLNKRRKKMRFWVYSLPMTKRQLDIIHTSSEEAEKSFRELMSCFVSEVKQ